MANEVCHSGVAHKLVLYPTDLSNLDKEGCLLTKLGGIFPLLSNVVEKLLRGRVSDELFDRIKQSCRDAQDHVIAGDDNLTFVYILTDEGFNTLNSMVVKCNVTEGNFKEFTLSVDCMYTNDVDDPVTGEAGFSVDDLPFFTEDKESQDLFEKYYTGEEGVLRRDKVYMFRVVSKEILTGVNGFRHKLYEYFIYIPRSELRNCK